MIEHIVLFKFTDQTTTSQMNELCKMYKSIKEKIDGVLEIQAGINFSSNNKGFQILLRAKLENEEKLNYYLNHTEHHEVAAFSREIGRIESIVMDIVI